MSKNQPTADEGEVLPVSLEQAIAPFAVTDPDAISRRIAEGTLRAVTLDEIFAASSTTKIDDVLGIPLTIRGVEFNPSGFDDGPQFYAVFDAIDEHTQQGLTIMCGAVQVLAQFIRVRQLQLFPVSVIFKRAEHASARGYYPVRAELTPSAF